MIKPRLETRMSIYDVASGPTKFVRAVKISGELAANPGHVIFTTALELYPNEDSNKFFVFNYHKHDYCLAIIDGIIFTKDVVPLINGIVNDMQICYNGNVKYRGFTIVRSGRIDSTSKYVYSTYNSNRAIINQSDTLDTALDRIDTDIIVK